MKIIIAMDHLLFFHVHCFSFKYCNNRHDFQYVSDTMLELDKKETEDKVKVSSCYSHNKSQASYILTMSWIFLAERLGIFFFFFFFEKQVQNITFLKALSKPPNLLTIPRNMVFLGLFSF